MPVARGETIEPRRTRQRVVDAAAELFYRRGTGVSVQELARRARVSKPTLYRHFDSKQGLLETVLRQRSDRVIAWMRASSDVPDDPLERVLAVFDALGSWYAEQGFRGCAIVNAAAQDPAADGPARGIARSHLARYRDLLEALAEDAGAPDPELAGRQLLILLEGATMVAALGEGPGAASAARQLARAALAGAPAPPQEA